MLREIYELYKFLIGGQDQQLKVKDVSIENTLTEFLGRLEIGKATPPNPNKLSDPQFSSDPPPFISPENTLHTEFYKLLRSFQPYESFVYGNYPYRNLVYINPFYEINIPFYGDEREYIPNQRHGFIFPLDKNGKVIVLSNHLKSLEFIIKIIAPIANMNNQFPPGFQNFLKHLQIISKNYDQYCLLKNRRNELILCGYHLPENPEEFRNMINLQQRCLQQILPVYIGPIVDCYISFYASYFQSRIKELNQNRQYFDLFVRIIYTNGINFFEEIRINTAPPPSTWPGYITEITPHAAKSMAYLTTFKCRKDFIHLPR